MKLEILLVNKTITNFLLYLTGETVESTAEVAAKGTKQYRYCCWNSH